MGRIDLRGRERKRRDEKEKVGRLGIGKRQRTLCSDFKTRGDFCQKKVNKHLGNEFVQGRSWHFGDDDPAKQRLRMNRSRPPLPNTH